jgi:hypothetical protein
MTPAKMAALLLSPVKPSIFLKPDDEVSDGLDELGNDESTSHNRLLK